MRPVRWFVTDRWATILGLVDADVRTAKVGGLVDVLIRVEIEALAETAIATGDAMTYDDVGGVRYHLELLSISDAITLKRDDRSSAFYRVRARVIDIDPAAR